MATRKQIKKTVEFVLEDDGYSYQVKFYNTEKFGNTVGFSQDYLNFIEFPASFILEVAKTIQQEGFVPKQSPMQSLAPQKKGEGSASIDLPLPTIVNSMNQPQQETFIPKVSEQNQYELPTIFPIESFDINYQTQENRVKESKVEETKTLPIPRIVGIDDKPKEESKEEEAVQTEEIKEENEDEGIDVSEFSENKNSKGKSRVLSEEDEELRKKAEEILRKRQQAADRAEKAKEKHSIKSNHQIKE